MDRRQFLRIGSFVTASVVGLGLAACAADEGEADHASGAGWKFPQSIASGDPQPDAIMLWTRAVPASAGDVSACDAGDFFIRLCLSDADQEARLGSNAALAGRVLLDTAVPVRAAFDHTVRHRISGLAPGTVYYYQFIAGDTRSRVGRFKTAPARGAALGQLRFAMLSCQDWSVNHWGALEDVVRQELDFVLHLGDYIYETVGEVFQTGAVEARHTPLALPEGRFKNGTDGARFAATLADYRYLYKQYRTDARLQAVHERFAMVAVWDDHEFSDDCWSDVATYENAAGDNLHQPARRRSANRAWHEYMPADIYITLDPAAGIDNVRIYRDLQFGSLAHLVITDERLYRSDHIIDEATPDPATGKALGRIGSRYMVPEAQLRATEAQKMAAAQAAGAHALTPVSMLGATQRAWWQQTMEESCAIWKLWVNEVALLRMGIDGGRAIATLLALQSAGTPTQDAMDFGSIQSDVMAHRQHSRFVAASGMASELAPFFTRFVLNADQWDGYDAERKALMQYLRDHQIRNVVALSGDIHAFFAGEVRDDYSADGGGRAVMVDVVTAGISSHSFFSYLKGAVGELCAGLVPLVHQSLRLPVPGIGSLDLCVNLLDYTLGAAAPTAVTLAESLRVPLRGALAHAGLPEASLDSALTSALERLQAQPLFTHHLLPLAQQLARLHSNPWLKFARTDAQGYALVTVTPAALRCEFHQVNQLVGDTAPASVVAQTTVATVPRGGVGLSIERGAEPGIGDATP